MTFDNPIEANIMKSKLESEDVLCFLFDENIVGLNPLYNITVGGIKLKIAEEDLERASKLAAEYTDSTISNEEGEVIECPKCHSNEIDGSFKSFKGMKGIISGILSLLLMVFPIFYKTVRKCKSCGFEFK